MTHVEIRQKFLSFFKAKEHKILPSSSLLPDNDPTVLLTTAGMQQFKGYFLGERDSTKEIGTRRAATIQKCFRTTDIDEAGDETHLTFFEMLGNFSFGDYFKREAIDFAYELLVKVFGLSERRLCVTVFNGDDQIPADTEAIDFWKKYLPEDQISEFGREANFWGPPGASGPCGPSSEIHYDLTGIPCARAKGCRPNCSCGRFIEIWNLVFMQYFCDEGRKYAPLKEPSVDTGAGLERLALILQNKSSVFETDLLQPLLFDLVTTKKILYDKDWRALRIIADHLRGSVFLIADGVRPSNVAQGYILRRIMRRIIRFAKELRLENKFYALLINRVIETFGKVYPELARRRNEILDAWTAEEEKFRKTLEKGLHEFNRLVLGVKTKGFGEIGGEAVFHLYDTYGFPFEFSLELAKEANMAIDKKGFDEEFKRHQMVSRAGIEGKFGGHGLILSGELKAGTEEEAKSVTRLHTATHLLHEALRRVLGSHVRQMGSDITPERLRFDFTHPQKLTADETKKIEALVNEQVARDLPRKVENIRFDDAISSGALAFFREKYPEVVNVYSFGDFSREVCGGPHVEHTGEIGRFKIIKEESVAAGVRRIKAVVE